METYRLYDAELKFMTIVWEREPVSTRLLTQLCQERLGWKRTTTYTVLKKLSDRGMVRNSDATVTALVKREQVQRYESGAVVDRSFGGSLPSFVAAFLNGHALSEEDAVEIQQLIAKSQEEKS